MMPINPFRNQLTTVHLGPIAQNSNHRNKLWLTLKTDKHNFTIKYTIWSNTQLANQSLFYGKSLMQQDPG